MAVDKEFCKKIVDYRVANNMSQAKLAELCKISKQTMCNVEQGIQSPSMLTKLKILKVIEGGR